MIHDNSLVFYFYTVSTSNQGEPKALSDQDEPKPSSDQAEPKPPYHQIKLNSLTDQDEPKPPSDQGEPKPPSYQDEPKLHSDQAEPKLPSNQADESNSKPPSDQAKTKPSLKPKPQVNSDQAMHPIIKQQQQNQVSQPKRSKPPIADKPKVLRTQDTRARSSSLGLSSKAARMPLISHFRLLKHHNTIPCSLQTISKPLNNANICDMRSTIKPATDAHKQLSIVTPSQPTPAGLDISVKKQKSQP